MIPSLRVRRQQLRRLLQLHDRLRIFAFADEPVAIQQGARARRPAGRQKGRRKNKQIIPPEQTSHNVANWSSFGKRMCFNLDDRRFGGHLNAGHPNFWWSPSALVVTFTALSVKERA
jgi:hypothetical protein